MVASGKQLSFPPDLGMEDVDVQMLAAIVSHVEPENEDYLKARGSGRDTRSGGSESNFL